jgi:hypothetical protein
VLSRRCKSLAIPAPLLVTLRILLRLPFETLLAPVTAIEPIPAVTAIMPFLALLEAALLASEPLAIVLVAGIAALAIVALVLSAIIGTRAVERSLLLLRLLNLGLRLTRLHDMRLIAGEFVAFLTQLIAVHRLEATWLRMAAAI